MQPKERLLQNDYSELRKQARAAPNLIKYTQHCLVVKAELPQTRMRSFNTSLWGFFVFVCLFVLPPEHELGLVCLSSLAKYHYSAFTRRKYIYQAKEV